MAISEVKIREITTNVESRRTALNHEVSTSVVANHGSFAPAPPHLQSINLSLKHTKTNYSNSSAVSKAKKMNDSPSNSQKIGDFSDFWPT